MPLPEIPRAAIEQRAHKIWIAKGRREGHAIEDWIQAETELRAEAARAARPAVPVFKPAAPAPGGNLASAPGALKPTTPSSGGTTPSAPSPATAKSGGKTPKGKKR